MIFSGIKVAYKPTADNVLLYQMIPIYKPYLNKYKTDAISAIESEWISNYGIYVDLASKKLKDFIGIKYCILMNNGTSATHCLFIALKFKYPSLRKIYIPNYTFIAPINCAMMEYPLDMIEVIRTDKQTMNMNVSDETLNSLQENSALVVVHNLGSIINVNKIREKRPDIIIIEDNCEGLFGKYDNMYTGASPATFCSAVSFYANKTITTGEGGAFFTNDLDTYLHIKRAYSHGMDTKRYIHNVLGYNYRMTNIQAAFLYSQLNDIDHILHLKQNVTDMYMSALAELLELKKIHLLKTDINTVKSNWMMVIKINNLNSYESLEEFMLSKNIQIRPFFYNFKCHSHLNLLNINPLEEDDLNVNGVMLPSYPELTLNEIQYISTCLEEYINSYLKI